MSWPRAPVIHEKNTSPLITINEVDAEVKQEDIIGRFDRDQRAGVLLVDDRGTGPEPAAAFASRSVQGRTTPARESSWLSPSPARDQRPTIELPRPSGAELWECGTSFRPISATGIGQVTSGENVYVTRLRLVPRRPGHAGGPARRQPGWGTGRDGAGRCG